MEEICVGRIQADGLTEICNSTLVVPITISRDAPVIVSISIGWLYLQCFCVVLNCLLIVAYLQVKPACIKSNLDCVLQ